MTGTRGVTVLGQVLANIAETPGFTAAELAASEDLPRSSVFDIVRRLDDAGFLARGEGGRLAPGPEAIRLGFAAYGLQPLCGPAEALLRLLRDQADATAALMVGDTVLLRLAARRQIGDDPPTFSAPVGEQARLTLTLRQGATRAARASAEALFQHVALSLGHYLTETSA